MAHLPQHPVCPDRVSDDLLSDRFLSQVFNGRPGLCQLCLLHGHGPLRQNKSEDGDANDPQDHLLHLADRIVSLDLHAAGLFYRLNLQSNRNGI